MEPTNYIIWRFIFLFALSSLHKQWKYAWSFHSRFSFFSRVGSAPSAGYTWLYGTVSAAGAALYPPIRHVSFLLIPFMAFNDGQPVVYIYIRNCWHARFFCFLVCFFLCVVHLFLIFFWKVPHTFPGRWRCSPASRTIYGVLYPLMAE